MELGSDWDKTLGITIRLGQNTRNYNQIGTKHLELGSDRDKTLGIEVSFTVGLCTCDEGRRGKKAASLLATKKMHGGRRACYVCDPGSELRQGRREKRRASTINGMAKNKTKNLSLIHI